MMRSLLLWPLGLALFASAVWGQSGGTEQAVAALEQKWLESQQTNNPDLVAPLLADKIVDTSSDGKVVDKAGGLSNGKKHEIYQRRVLRRKGDRFWEYGHRYRRFQRQGNRCIR